MAAVVTSYFMAKLFSSWFLSLGNAIHQASLACFYQVSSVTPSNTNKPAFNGTTVPVLTQKAISKIFLKIKKKVGGLK